MRQNMSRVIEAFRNRVACKGDSKNTCSTDGETVFSYAMPIARRIRGAIRIIAPERAPSVTTRSQVNALRVAFPDAGLLTAEGAREWTPEEKRSRRGPMSGDRL